MCLILFAYRYHPGTDLLVLANRDEFHARPALQAAFWKDRPDLLAGRDLAAGGTWLGVDTRGRFAAVTNFRDPGQVVSDATTRGSLVPDFLDPDTGGNRFLARLVRKGNRYNGFNLLAFDGKDLVWWSNRSFTEPAVLAPGLYGLSNHLLDTPWPKVEEGKRAFSRLLASGLTQPLELLQVLEDGTTYPAERLPDTGVGHKLEIMLSAAKIEGAEYGTRCSTVVKLESDGGVHFLERTHIPADLDPATVEHRFQASLKPGWW